jgi:membrane protease YdiL (CAAX protease family)
MRRSPVMVVVIGFALFFVGQMFVQTALALLGLIYDGNAMAVMQLNAQPPEVIAESASLIRVAHIIGQFLGWGFAAWFGASLLGKPTAELGLGGPVSWRNVALAAVIIICATPLAQLLVISKDWEGFSWMTSFVEQAREMEFSNEAKTKAILEINTPGALLFNIVTFAVTPAICEELFFRGLIQRNLLKAMPPVAAILITAVIFSLFHFALFGFFARAFLGVILGLLAWKGASLWPAIAAHFVFNLSTVLSIAYGWDAYADQIPLWITALTAMIMLLGLSTNLKLK